MSLANLIVQENLGDGAWIAAATVTIRDRAFADNRATGGAGLVLSDPADATVLRCSFDRQRATRGGGLSIGGVNTGRVSVVECQFRDASSGSDLWQVAETSPGAERCRCGQSRRCSRGLVNGSG